MGKTEINKVYDPACGSGSLLLKAEKVLGREAVRNGFMGRKSILPHTTCVVSICFCMILVLISLILPVRIH